MSKYSAVFSETEASTHGDATSAARAFVQRLQTVKESTETDYAKKYLRIRSDSTPPDLTAMAGTKRSFYALRAAFIRGATLELKDLLKARDAQRRAGDKEASAASLVRIKVLLEQLNFWSPRGWVDPEKENRARGLSRALGESIAPTFAEAQQEGKTMKAQSTAKRGDASKWSKHGFNGVWNEAKESQWATWTALCIAAGLRPEELAQNRIDITASANLVTIRVRGAKVDGVKGQPWRSISLKRGGDTEVSAALEHLAAHSGIVRPPENGQSAKEAFRKYLARMGKRVWPRGPQLSPYIFRHAFAADLKSDGCDREMLAMALGHTATQTGAAYGNVGGGKQGRRTMYATAERNIRVNHNISDSLQPSPSIDQAPHAARQAAPPQSPPTPQTPRQYQSADWDIRF